MIRRRSRTGTRTTPAKASAMHPPPCGGWRAGGTDGGDAMDATTTIPAGAATDNVRVLKQLERKLLWLSSWMIHHANHIRPNRDGLKVGGHQASCASVISIMAALYFA